MSEEKSSEAITELPATNDLLASTSNPENSDSEVPTSWNLTETLKGEGEVPEWFKKDKYANVSEQAKAYTELEKTKPLENAPEKYELGGLANDTALDVNSSFFHDWMEMEKTSKTSQEQFNKRLEFFDKYLKSMRPDKTLEMEKLGGGEIATNKLAGLSSAIQNILSKEDFEIYRDSLNKTGTADIINVHMKILAHFKETPVAPTESASNVPTQTIEEFMDETDPKRYTEDKVYQRQRDRELAAFPIVNGK